jgi:hypothetical protein
MARRYCTVNDVVSLMPPDIFNIGTAITDTITETEVNELIELATIDMESQLASFYSIPLTPVRLGTITGSTEYPPPIPYICARKAVALIYDRYFASTAGASDASQYVQALEDDAEKSFQMILDGRRRLLGQRLVGRRFCRQTLLETPYAPRGEGGAQA